jgi:hypothetical protein
MCLVFHASLMNVRPFILLHNLKTQTVQRKNSPLSAAIQGYHYNNFGTDCCDAPGHQITACLSHLNCSVQLCYDALIYRYKGNDP